MFDTIVYYVLPNVALFGGIVLFSKMIEAVAWHVIENYEEYTV